MSAPALTPSDREFYRFHKARIEALPEEEQAREREDLQSQISAHLKALEDADTTMTATEYLEALATLDLTDEQKVAGLAVKTVMGEVDPVPLGSHKGYEYVLIPCNDSVPSVSASALSPLDEMGSLSQWFNSYVRQPIPGSPSLAPDLRYGLGLGRLAHRPQADASAGYENTWYYVVLNAIDRSIWITINWSPMDLEPYDPLAGDDWGRLPGDPSLRIGTMKISQAEWASSPGRALVGAPDPFVNNPAIDCWLATKPARVKDIEAARQKIK